MTSDSKNEPPPSATEGGSEVVAPIGKRERNKAAKRAALLGAAGRLFREQGYEATTTRQISKAAGVATGTLFTYFEDKPALLRELFLSEIDDVSAVAAATRDDSAPLVDQLMHMFAPLFAFYRRDVALGREIFKEFMFRSDLDSVTRRYIGHLVAVFEAAKARGVARPNLASMAAAFTAFGLYINGVLVILQDQLDPQTHRALVRTSIELFVEGLRP